MIVNLGQIRVGERMAREPSQHTSTRERASAEDGFRDAGRGEVVAAEDDAFLC